MDIDTLYTHEPAAKKPRLGETTTPSSDSSDSIFPEDSKGSSAGVQKPMAEVTSNPTATTPPNGVIAPPTDAGTPAASIPGLFLLDDPSQAISVEYLPVTEPPAVENEEQREEQQDGAGIATIKQEEKEEEEGDSVYSPYSPKDVPTPAKPAVESVVKMEEEKEDVIPISNGTVAADSAPIKEEHAQQNGNEQIMNDPTLLARNVGPDGEEENGDPEWEWDSSNAEESSSSDSSDSDSDSDSSSSDSDSDDDNSAKEEGEDSDAEDAVYNSISQEAKRLMEEDAAGSEDEDGGGSAGKKPTGGLRTKNEVPEDQVKVPRPNIELAEGTEITHLGVVESMVDNLVLIKATVSGEYQVLNEGSLLVFPDKSIVGTVQDTIGRVEQPLYTVRFNDQEEIESVGVKIGKEVFYVPSHSTFVFTKALKAVKGSDASNLYDEEVQEEEQEWSDDEAEAEYKRKKKQARKGGENAQHNKKDGAGNKRPREAAELDEPYVPLTRPQNLLSSGTNGSIKYGNPPERTNAHAAVERSNSVPGHFGNNQYNSNNNSNNRGGRGGFQRGNYNQRGGRGWNSGGARGGHHQNYHHQQHNHEYSRGGRGGGGSFRGRNSSWAHSDASSRMDYDQPEDSQHRSHYQDPSRYYNPSDYQQQRQQDQSSSQNSQPSSQATSPQSASFLTPNFLSVMTQLANATANANSNSNANAGSPNPNEGFRPQLSPLSGLPPLPFPPPPPPPHLAMQMSPGGGGGDMPIALPSGAHVNPAFFRRQSFPAPSPTASDSFQSPPPFGSPPSTAMSPTAMSPQESAQATFQSVQEILRRLQS